MDVLSRGGLHPIAEIWIAPKSSEEIWMPEKVTNMIESLHTELMVNVRNEVEVSDTFAITNGVKQGCVLAPTLFSIFLSTMLKDVFRGMGGRSLHPITQECRPLYNCTLQSEDK